MVHLLDENHEFSTPVDSISEQDRSFRDHIMASIQKLNKNINKDTDNDFVPVVTTKLLHKHVDTLLVIIMLYPDAEECYNTNNTLIKRGVKKNVKCAWQVRENHACMLEKMSKKHGIDLAEMMKLEKSIRIKIHQGFKWLFIRSKSEGNSVAYLTDHVYYEKHRLGKEMMVAPLVFSKMNSANFVYNKCSDKKLHQRERILQEQVDWFHFCSRVMIC
jgi:hypothetical protein